MATNFVPGRTNPTSGKEWIIEDGTYCWIGSKKWYYYFKSNSGRTDKRVGLCDEVNAETISKSLVVQFTIDKKRLFTNFVTIKDFLTYEAQFPNAYRGFYETILGQNGQKPHFDIDVDLRDEHTKKYLSEHPDLTVDQVMMDLMEKIIDGIGVVFQKIGVVLDLTTDLLLFSSHGKTKRSYHVVVDNYYHTDHLEAGALCKLVLNQLPKDYHRWLDYRVYSKLQQFRMEGSQKIGSGRPKILNLVWDYHGQKVVYRTRDTIVNDYHLRQLIFEASLVSRPRGAKLESLLEMVPEMTKKAHQIEGLWLTEQDGSNVLQLLADEAGVSTTDSRFPYKLSQVTGGLVLLKRIRPSYCRVCNREHENENPYMVVVGRYKDVYFNCRRNEYDKYWYVGSLEAGLADEVNERQYTDDELKSMTPSVPSINGGSRKIPSVPSINGGSREIPVPGLYGRHQISHSARFRSSSKSVAPNKVRPTENGVNRRAFGDQLPYQEAKTYGIVSAPINTLIQLANSGSGTSGKKNREKKANEPDIKAAIQQTMSQYNIYC